MMVINNKQVGKNITFNIGTARRSDTSPTQGAEEAATADATTQAKPSRMQGRLAEVIGNGWVIGFVTGAFFLAIGVILAG